MPLRLHFKNKKDIVSKPLQMVLLSFIAMPAVDLRPTKNINFHSQKRFENIVKQNELTEN